MPRRRNVHLLILGYGSIVHRRVLPAAQMLPRIERISVASRTHGGRAKETLPTGHGAKPLGWFSDYDQALATSGADAVYVSGVNSVHEEWVTRALERGLHVMVDKPAFLDLPSTETALALAHRNRRGLAEATVFAFHPQIAALQALVPRDELPSTRVTAFLAIPPRPPGDFRLSPELGGGSLYDQTPYVAATNRLIFGKPPEHLECRVLSRDDATGVDTSFSVLLAHDHGGAMIGHYGFVTTYLNRLLLLTPSRVIDVDRVFTTPPATASVIHVRENDQDRTVHNAPADSFVLFLDAFIDAIERDDFATFEHAILEDARLTQRLRDAAATRSLVT